MYLFFFMNNTFQEKISFFTTILQLVFFFFFYNVPLYIIISSLALFALQNQKCKRSWKIFRRWRVLV